MRHQRGRLASWLVGPNLDVARLLEPLDGSHHGPPVVASLVTQEINAGPGQEATLIVAHGEADKIGNHYQDEEFGPRRLGGVDGVSVSAEAHGTPIPESACPHGPLSVEADESTQGKSPTMQASRI